MKLKTLLTLAAISVSAQASVVSLVGYNFTGNLADADGGIGTGTASAFDPGTGGVSALRVRFRDDWTTSTAANASALDATFSYTVGADTETTLDSFTFDYTNDIGTGNSNFGIAFYASTDGTNYTLIGDETTGGLDSVVTNLSMDLTSFNAGASYTTGDTLYFGFSVYDATSLSTRYHYIDTLRLKGTEVVTATVPEPSAIALLGLGGLALFSRRKR